MRVRRVTKQELDAFPHCVWNAYLDLLANEDYDDLTSEQRAAQLVFLYESEVQNGGHLQFFENRGSERLEETIEALGALGACSQQQLLREAGQAWLSRPRPRIETAEEFSEAALDGEFAAFDLRFMLCEPTLYKKLEEYLSQRQSSFILIT
jgi:hypothetical protein